ncbi:MAG: hypothetical protein ACOC8F_06545 [Planctomycetota bacterium]
MRNALCAGLCIGLAGLAVGSGCSLEAWKLRREGIAAFQVGKLDEARSKLAESIEREPNDARACYYLGRTLHAQGYQEDALYYYQCCLQREPAHAEARRWLNKAADELGPVAEELMFLPTGDGGAVQPTTRPGEQDAAQ